MRAIQISASYKPAFIYGGPTMSVSKLSEVLVERGIKIEVLTTSANGSGELSVNEGQLTVIDNVPVTYYKRLTKDHTHFSPALYIALWRKLNSVNEPGQKSLPIVHIHTWWNLVSVFSCLIALIKKASVVLSPRGTLSTYSFGNRNNFFKRIIYILSKPMLRRCHFHATSENEKTALLQLVKPRSISVIPNLVTLPTERPVSSYRTAEDATLKLLFFSRVEQKKGLELLFEALGATKISYTLTIAGPGEFSYIGQLKRLAVHYNIASNIFWIGNQSPEKKFDIMAAYDLLVLPSYDENFANVVIESLSTGTAVLVTENVGLSDYVKQNKFGWICKFEVNDLRANLEAAASNIFKRTAIRKDAPTRIKNDFSDIEVSQQYIDMYNRILKNV